MRRIVEYETIMNCDEELAEALEGLDEDIKECIEDGLEPFGTPVITVRGYEFFATQVVVKYADKETDGSAI